MSILALLLATVLTASVGQALLSLLLLRNRWYSRPLRLALVSFLVISSAGGLSFVIASLSGGEALPQRFVFAGGWACVIGIVVVAEARKAVGRGDMERDTNERVREMQTRGQEDQPDERTDREEGHTHRSNIDARLIADTELRRDERQAERKERADERQAEREERNE